MEQIDFDSRESDFKLAGESDTVIFSPNHALAARPRRREQDGRPQRIFFYKRMDTDAVVYFTEQEAALMEKSSHGPFLRQIGCSDGSAYAAFLRATGLKPKERIPKERAEEILRGALAAEIAAATGNFARPMAQNVHFDASFPVDQRGTFVPPR